MLKLKEEEEKLLGKLNNMLQHQSEQYSKIKTQINELEVAINNHYGKIDNLMKDYINSINKFEKDIYSSDFDKIDKLRKDYLDHLKSFDITNINNEEKEKIYHDNNTRDILEIKYQEMNKLHKLYKIKEIDIIRDYLNSTSKNLVNKCDEILESQGLYEQMYKHYIFRRNELGQYQDGINELRKTEEAFYENKNNLYESRVKGAVSSVNFYKN